jgi:hypothetical protein
MSDHAHHENYVSFLKSEIQEALDTVALLERERDVLKAQIDNERAHWGFEASVFIESQRRTIQKLKREIENLRSPRMKQADTELLPLGKANQL